MTIVNAREILHRATKEKYAVGAFNVTSVLQMKAVIEAAEHKKSAVIVQTSVTPAKFYGPKLMSAAFRVLAESAAVPVCLHLDHCTDVDFCKECADAGYTNIMIDASKDGFENNVSKTKEVVDYCHGLGNITVEGELGTVLGVEDNVEVKDGDISLCDPDKALEFVERTGIDLFAPAIGTAHGMYRNAPNIDFELLSCISSIVNSEEVVAPIVIHGGTGISVEVTKKLIALGGAKFNISTDLKHCFIDSVSDYLEDNKNEYNPGKLDATVYSETFKLVEKWIDILGCGGKYD